MPDIRMPDGTIIRNVPAGTPKDEILRRYNASKAIKRNTKNSPISSALFGAADMLSFGFDDEIFAGVDSVLPIPGRANIWQGKGLAEAWRINQRERSKLKQETQRNNPKSYLGGQIAGALAPAVATGGANLAANAGRAANASRIVRAARAVAPAVAQGAAYGAGSTDGGLQERAKGAATGAVLGLAGDLAGRGIGAAASRIVGGARNVAPQVRRLADSGVLMTPGQRAGPRSLTNRTEEVLQSVWGLGDVIRGARSRGVRDLNEAVYNEALAPIGASLIPGAPVTREAIARVDDLASDTLTNAIAPLSMQADNALQAELAAIRQQAPGTVGPLSGQLDANIQNIVESRLQNGGASGPALGDMIAELRAARSGFAGGRGNEANLAGQIGRVEDVVMDGIERTAGNPQGIQVYRDARQAVANVARLNKGAARATEGRLDNGALMTPSQILSAVKAPGYGVTARRVARGEAPMQSLAEAGAAVLPDVVPNSGTVDRALMLSLAGAAGAGGGTAYATDGNMTAAGLAAVPFLLYTRPGQQMLQNMALNRDPRLIQAAGAIERAQPALARTGAAGALGIFGSP